MHLPIDPITRARLADGLTLDTLNDASCPRRKASDAGTEERLLEANRRRLLERESWDEVALSRRVNIPFASRDEKSSFGKRRNVDGRARPRRNSRERIIRQPLHDTDNTISRPGLHGSEAQLNNAKDIRIRIGTDALSSQPLMQRNSYAQSSKPDSSHGDSSDLMLLDDEDLSSAPKESVQPPRSVNERRSVSAGSFRRKQANSSQCPMKGWKAQMPGSPRTHDPFKDPRSGRCPLERAEGSAAQPNRILHSVGRVDPVDARPQKEEAGSSFHLTRRVGGTGRRPLRLISPQTSDLQVHIGGRMDVQADVDNNIDYEQANAALAEVGQTKSKAGNERGIKSADKEAAIPSSIVDDGPWRAFLAIPEDNSSHSAVAPTSRPFQSLVMESHDSGPAVWSQHATLGDQTCISSSSALSTSFPSIKHTDGQSTTGNRWQAKGRRSNSTIRPPSHRLDEDEKLWKAFVFESEDNPVSEMMHDGSVNGEGISKASKRVQSDVTSCMAVASSARSSPLPTISQSASRHRSRISDNADNTAGRAPILTPQGSRSQTIISPISRAHGDSDARRIESQSQQHTDGVLPRSGLGGGHSVTHASLFNNASHDTGSPLSSAISFSSGRFGTA